jgi:hypothetical protein
MPTMILQNGIKTQTEKTHQKFCKLYLGVNRKASNNGSRGELGKLPLIIQIIKKILNYVTNLYKLPNSTLVKQAFLSSKELYLNGKESFYSNTVNLLHKHFPTLEKTVDLEHFINDNKVKNIIDQIKMTFRNGNIK